MFVLNSVVMLNLLPMLWNFLDSPLIYGTDNIHAGLLSLYICVPCRGFLLINITYTGYALNNRSFFIKFSLAKLFCLLALYIKFCTIPFLSCEGGPRNRWQDEVIEDGRIVGGEGWQEKVQDRKEWKKLLRMARNRQILHTPLEWMNEGWLDSKDIVLHVWIIYILSFSVTFPPN